MTEKKDFVIENRAYIEATIQHFDSNIRMSVMSDFERLAMIEMKEFFEGLLKRIPDHYVIPPYFG